MQTVEIQQSFKLQGFQEIPLPKPIITINKFDIAPSAEPFDDVRINIENVTPLPQTNLSKMCSQLYSITNSIWSKVEGVSEWVTDILGITAPRYEMYIDDSIEFLANQEAEDAEIQEKGQERVLIDAIN
jgi:hypothetical protein